MSAHGLSDGRLDQAHVTWDTFAYIINYAHVVVTQARALQQAQQQVQGGSSQKIPDAVAADKGVAVADVLEKAGVTHLAALFEEEKIDMWSLKELVRHEEAWKGIGLKWSEVHKLKDALKV